MLVFEISKGYRSTRRTISILCALALSWSVAQIDFKTVTAGPLGAIDMSRAVIPLLFFCGIIYTTFRLVIEYAMQAVEIRRWGYAKLDFTLTILLIRVTVLFLAASGLHRSIEIVLYLMVVVLGVLVLSAIAIFFGSTPLMLIIARIIMRGKGSYSAARSVMLADGLSILIICFVLILFFILLGYASIHYVPLRTLWPVSPKPLSLTIFVVAFVVVLGSLLYESKWNRKIFAYPPDYEHPSPVWDWYNQPVNQPSPPNAQSYPKLDSSNKNK